MLRTRVITRDDFFSAPKSRRRRPNFGLFSLHDSVRPLQTQPATVPLWFLSGSPDIEPTAAADIRASCGRHKRPDQMPTKIQYNCESRGRSADKGKAIVILPHREKSLRFAPRSGPEASETIACECRDKYPASTGHRSGSSQPEGAMFCDKPATRLRPRNSRHVTPVLRSDAVAAEMAFQGLPALHG